MAAGAGTVTIRILGDAANLKSTLNQASQELGGFESKVQGLSSKLKSIGGKLTAGVTLPIVGMFAAAGAAAADEQQKMEVLANLLRNTTGATQDQIDANEEWITSMQNATGVADDELRVAMGKLVVAGRDVEQSHKDLAVAADIAAARHIDLDTVVNAMAKAAQGSTGALQKLGIETKGAAGEALTYDQILQNASKTMGGSAAAAANTAAGKMEILKLKLADVAEQIGSAVLPIVSKLADWFGKLAEWFTNLSPRIQTLIVVFAGLAAAIGPVMTVIGSLGAAFGILVSPVALVVLAIAAVAAGAIYAYTHFKTFRDVVDTIAEKVATFASVMRDALDPVFKFISAHSDELKVALGALAVVVGALLVVSLGSLAIAFGTVSAAIIAAVTVVTAITAGLEWLWERTKGLRDFLGGAFSNALDVVTTAFGFVRDVIQAVTEKTEPLRAVLAGPLLVALTTIATTVHVIGDAFLWLKDHVLGPVTAAISGVVGLATDAFDAITSLANAITGNDISGTVNLGGLTNIGNPSINPRQPGAQASFGRPAQPAQPGSGVTHNWNFAPGAIVTNAPEEVPYVVAQHQRAAQFLGN